jgi:hypothetical protein
MGRRTPNSDTPGAYAPPLRPPQNVIGAVLNNCGNTRFCIYPVHGISSAGWEREGCNPSCQNIESNRFDMFDSFEDINKALILLKTAIG